MNLQAVGCVELFHSQLLCKDPLRKGDGPGGAALTMCDASHKWHLAVEISMTSDSSLLKEKKFVFRAYHGHAGVGINVRSVCGYST